MVYVYFGEKGMGKTKKLIDDANNMIEKGKGDVVFIDQGNGLMCNLNHKARFINISDFPVDSISSFLGFICGVIAEDYDIEGIFIDGLTYIVKDNAEAMEGFFVKLKQISEKYNVKFFISMNGNEKYVPDYLKLYIA